TMHEFTKNPRRRTIWVNAVRTTSEGRRSLMESLSGTKIPYLCASHFLPSDYNHKAPIRMLRINAVPFFQDPSEEPCREPIKYSGGVLLEETVADEESKAGVERSYACLQCGKNLGSKAN
ncbi:hypothetical protein PMAYCL1PPCAC_19569, partial [Pristionchus mayeri]